MAPLNGTFALALTRVTHGQHLSRQLPAPERARDQAIPIEQRGNLAIRKLYNPT